jgi:beta-phosphoglucomutase-like phosphatase (HAD superfamily)
MLKAVIFDVGGTLVDSVDLHAKGWQDAFAEFGYAIKYLKIRRLLVPRKVLPEVPEVSVHGA